MSGFELKNAAASTNESRGPDTNPIVANANPKDDGGSADLTEILSRRFASLSLIRTHDDAAFYHARDLRASGENRLITLKVLLEHPDTSYQPELFRLEALAAAKLSHQNVIRSSPPEELQGIHFSIVESRPQVETLKSLLDRGGWLELKPAIAFIHQIADALDHAHRLGILHLRLHPENILIDTDGTALLADFGLEAGPQLAWAHWERVAQCPVHYISPEHARGKPLDSRSDLYSLGVVLYQMLTDRLPFDSEDLATVTQKHLTQTPLAPHLYCSNIPLSVSAVISRLLEKDPNKRFQDVASFRAELAGDTLLTYGADIEEDLPELLLGTDDETDQPTTALDSLTNSGDREAWEPPTITVIDPPIAQASLSRVTEAVFETEAPSRPRESLSASDQRFRFNSMTGGKELNLPTASTAQWRPIILVVILATAAFIGLIVLARADAEPPNRTLPKATEHSGAFGENSKPAALPPNNAESDSVSVSLQPNPPENTRSETRPGGVDMATSPAARSQQPSVRTTSKSRRARKPKRKWRQPTRYFREAMHTDRRYSRPGVR